MEIDGGEANGGGVLEMEVRFFMRALTQSTPHAVSSGLLLKRAGWIAFFSPFLFVNADAIFAFSCSCLLCIYPHSTFTYDIYGDSMALQPAAPFLSTSSSLFLILCVHASSFSPNLQLD